MSDRAVASRARHDPWACPSPGDVGRDRTGDSLYGIRTIHRAGRENLTDKPHVRLHAAFTDRDERVEVEVAWRCA